MINFSRWLIFLTIIAVPLYVIRDHFWLPFFNFWYPTTFLEVMVIATFLVSAISFFKSGHDFKKIKTKYDGLILLFLLLAFIEIFFSYDFWGGLGVFKAYFVEPVLFFYCVIFVFKGQSLKRLIDGLILVGVWVAVLGLIQKLTGSFTLAPEELKQGRITAVYNSANALVLFIAPISFLVLSRFFSTTVLKTRILYGLLFGFFGLIIFWSRSRGGMIAEFFGLGAFAYILLSAKVSVLRKKWYLILAVLVILIIIGASYFYQNNNFIPADYGRPYTNGDTLQIRYFIWAGTVNLLKQHFWFGSGLNGFKRLYSNQYMLPQYRENFQYPHNLLLTFWSETGIFGLAGFLLILVRAFKIIILSLKKDSRSMWMTAFFAILVYWLVHGLVDVPYFKNDLSLEFWLVLALIQLAE